MQGHQGAFELISLIDSINKISLITKHTLDNNFYLSEGLDRLPFLSHAYTKQINIDIYRNIATGYQK